MYSVPAFYALRDRVGLVIGPIKNILRLLFGLGMVQNSAAAIFQGQRDPCYSRIWVGLICLPCSYLTLSKWLIQNEQVQFSFVVLDFV